LRPAIIIGDLLSFFVFVLTIPFLVPLSHSFQSLGSIPGGGVGAQTISSLAAFEGLDLVMLEAVVPRAFRHGSSRDRELAT